MRSSLLQDENDRLFNLKLALVLTDKDIYIDTMIDFYFVFCTLENELHEHIDHPCVNGVVPEELYRTEAFERDLEYIIGEGWRETIKPSAPAEVYCSRIIKVANKDPTLLLA